MNIQAGGFVKDQAYALSNAGHEVVVLSVLGLRWRRWNEIEDSHIHKIKDNNITVYNTRYRGIAQSRIPKIGIYCFNNKLIKMYEEAVSENGKPDVLYAHFSYPAGYGASIIAENNNIPLIVLEHHSLLLKNNISRTIVEALKYTIDRSDEFMCVSKSLKRSVKRLTNTYNSITVLPNILDSRFTYKPSVEKSEFVFFSAGNFVKGKAFDVLIKAFIQAFSNEENVKLLIAGDGPEKSKFEELITNNNREAQIKLLGRLNRDSMIKNYEFCDCFALASKRETFGIVYREAMAIGRPVISTKNGGIEEGWSDTFGLLTEIDDINGLSYAFKKMKEEINSYDGKLISNVVLEKYSEETIIRQLENKFEKIRIRSK